MKNSSLRALGAPADSLETASDAAELASCLPVPTALYRHFDAEGALLYVGISLSPTYRLSQHRDASPWFQRIVSIKVAWFDDRTAALKAEKQAIQSEQPEFNVVHKASSRESYLVERVEESCAELTRKVTRFNAAYDVVGAASTIGISPAAVRFAMAAGDLPYYPAGTKSVCVSGWSLIEYLEALQGGSLKVRSPPKLEDGRHVTPPTNEWLAENIGNTTVAAWVAVVAERRAATMDMTAA